MFCFGDHTVLSFHPQAVEYAAVSPKEKDVVLLLVGINEQTNWNIIGDGFLLMLVQLGEILKVIRGAQLPDHVS